MTQASANVNVMIKAARKAARSLLRDFGEVEQLQVSSKGPGDFVSRADLKAEQLVRDELMTARPNYGWLGEETGAAKGADPTRRWLVDPLDGTTNFLHGLPHWSVSIGLEHKGEVVAGVVYDPVKDEIFVAEKGAGAWVNDRRLRVSGRPPKGMPVAKIISIMSRRPETRRRRSFIHAPAPFSATKISSLTGS